MPCDSLSFVRVLTHGPYAFVVTLTVHIRHNVMHQELSMLKVPVLPQVVQRFIQYVYSVLDFIVSYIQPLPPQNASPVVPMSMCLCGRAWLEHENLSAATPSLVPTSSSIVATQPPVTMWTTPLNTQVANSNRVQHYQDQN
jgi:hypothetical protein